MNGHNRVVAEYFVHEIEQQADVEFSRISNFFARYVKEVIYRFNQG